ncbi:MAG TPA: EamA family transporter [Xanthobacteraceae bacterium]|nr:EamA family transporter [Xanthobacteraceae bacterium]
METAVFWAVLAAAAMHAGWNAVVKVDLDRFSAILLLALVQSGLAVVLLPFFPLPAMPSLPWLVASALLHTGYKLVLIRAYAHGDLSQVYPIARGSAPLIVLAVAALWLGETPSIAGLLAVAAIAVGVIMMSMRGGEGGALSATALGYAALTAAATAAYTLVDTIGARLAETASGFTLWMFVGDGLCMLLAAMGMRGVSALRGLSRSWRSGLIAGALSLGAYWIAIWGFTRAPVGLVAALRETSVLFAMLIALVVLRERVGPWRWLAAVLMTAGIAFMRI